MDWFCNKRNLVPTGCGRIRNGCAGEAAKREYLEQVDVQELAWDTQCRKGASFLLVVDMHARARAHTRIYIYILSPWMFKFCMSLNFSGCVAIRLWTCTMWRATRGKESKADIQNKVDNRQAPRASSSQTRNLSRKHQVKDLQIKGNQNDEPS